MYNGKSSLCSFVLPQSVENIAEAVYAHSTSKSHPIADFDLKWLHILLCVYKCGSLKLVLAINNSVCSKVTAGGTAFKWFISLLVIHPEFYEYEPQCHHTLSVDPFSLSWQCCPEIQGGKKLNDMHIRNRKMLLNSVKHKPHLSSSSFSLHLWSPLFLENNTFFLFKAGFCCPHVVHKYCINFSHMKLSSR